jgi:phytoene desaturase
MPEVWEETFAVLGEKLSDHLQLVRIDPTYKVRFADGSQLELTSNLGRMQTELEKVEKSGFTKFLAFMAEGSRHYKLSLEKFVGRNFYNIFEYFSPANLPLLFQLKALQKHYANTSRFFKDDRLRAAFTFQNMYLGLSPYDAPASYSLLQYTELAEGVWFPRGGMYQAIRSLAGIAEGLGVRFRYNAEVSRIDVAGTRATGVTLASGERLRADAVVANADLPYVYAQLLPDDGTAKRLAKKQYTSSALMFYWGVCPPGGGPADGGPHGGPVAADAAGPAGREQLEAGLSQLLHHNVFLADHQYRESFERIFRDHTLPDAPSFYVCAPARTDPGFAPPGGDSLMALVPVGHIDAADPGLG